MPSWTQQEQRQYAHIKDSTHARGTVEGRAKEIAARTVNKQRRKRGETPNKTTQGTGNPHQPLEAHSKDELYNQAKMLNIPGRSKMGRQALIAAIRDRQ